MKHILLILWVVLLPGICLSGEARKDVSLRQLKPSERMGRISETLGTTVVLEQVQTSALLNECTFCDQASSFSDETRSALCRIGVFFSLVSNDPTLDGFAFRDELKILRIAFPYANSLEDYIRRGTTLGRSTHRIVKVLSGGIVFRVVPRDSVEGLKRNLSNRRFTDNDDYPLIEFSLRGLNDNASTVTINRYLVLAPDRFVLLGHRTFGR